MKLSLLRQVPCGCKFHIFRPVFFSGFFVKKVDLSLTFPLCTVSLFFCFTFYSFGGAYAHPIYGPDCAM